MGLKTELYDTMKGQIEELDKMQVGTDEYKIAVDGVTKLADRIIELERIENEMYEKDMEQRTKEVEHDLKRRQIELENKRGNWANWIAGGTAAGGLIVTVWGALKTWKYEETGIIASGPGRKFMDKLLKFK